MKRIYVAGRMTGAHPATIEWSERLGLALRDRVFETFVPSQDEESPNGCFKRDLEEMAKADLLVASLFEPSTGVGIELVLFLGPILIVHKPGELSPMVKGLAEARGYVLLPLETNQVGRVVNMVEWILGTTAPVSFT